VAEVILTVGLPYSGKTTWAMDQGLPIVSPDAVRLAMHGQRFIGQAEPWVWAQAHAMLDALVAAGCYRVIVDATNVKPKRRMEWIERHPRLRFSFALFPATREECLRRARDAGDTEIRDVIDRQAKEWEADQLNDWAGATVYGPFGLRGEEPTVTPQ